MPSANPKPNLLPFFARIDELAKQLPSDADPALLHIICRRKITRRPGSICKAATRKTGPATAGMFSWSSRFNVADSLKAELQQQYARLQPSTFNL